MARDGMSNRYGIALGESIRSSGFHKLNRQLRSAAAMGMHGMINNQRFNRLAAEPKAWCKELPRASNWPKGSLMA
jgi:hypothetical protein